MATILALITGLVITALGTSNRSNRAVASPGLTALAVRSFRQRMPLVTDTTVAGDGHDCIEGEVIDVLDVEAPILP
ncbi:hypothetical protein [Mycobacterium leprae]|uniref:hypothetical protein n=1 Tax=Mycobacterium leprae TaxID=1769 RepID=UPI001E45F4DE|nr:hypothetical protein [Mycobacterium leprae]